MQRRNTNAGLGSPTALQRGQREDARSLYIFQNPNHAAKPADRLVAKFKGGGFGVIVAEHVVPGLGFLSAHKDHIFTDLQQADAVMNAIFDNTKQRLAY
jgi:hypothetical protein